MNLQEKNEELTNAIIAKCEDLGLDLVDSTQCLAHSLIGLVAVQECESKVITVGGLGKATIVLE